MKHKTQKYIVTVNGYFNVGTGTENYIQAKVEVEAQSKKQAKLKAIEKAKEMDAAFVFSRIVIKWYDVKRIL